MVVQPQQSVVSDTVVSYAVCRQAMSVGWFLKVRVQLYAKRVCSEVSWTTVRSGLAVVSRRAKGLVTKPLLGVLDTAMAEVIVVMLVMVCGVGVARLLGWVDAQTV